MKVLLLISGSLRSFRDNIHRLPSQYDIAVYVSRKDDDTYFNPDNVRFLLEDSRIKTLVVEEAPVAPPEYTDERQRNTYKQWYKLRRLFACVPSTYDVYVRLRPDVFLHDPDQLVEIVSTPSTCLRIPKGNDRDGLNDQIAIGNYDTMKQYCGVVVEPNISSERLLADHLTSTVERVSLDYKLVLSTAKVVAIAGDSGSGKTTLAKLIRPLFFFDKLLEFETDRYHKWERGDTHWNTLTHLDPTANHLEKLENDTFNLKLGNSVIAVDYDHSTGKFTPPQTIEPKENIVLCGLHTLYSDRLRTLADLKIYVDTSEELKTEWKLNRDVNERGHAKSDVLAKIESRRNDYKVHVAPQKDYADIIVRRQKDSLTLIVRKLQWCTGLEGTWKDNAITFAPNVNVQNAAHRFLQQLRLPLIDIEPGLDGVIQFTILQALYSNG